MLSSVSIAPPSYYEGLAEELESIAEAVRKHPNLHTHFAERLDEIAQQIREDARLMRIARSPS